MSLVNVLERQRGWKEIARINHSENALGLPARVQKTQREKENKRNEADLPSEGTNGTPANMPNRGRALHKKSLLFAATVSTIYDLNAYCIHGDKAIHDSYVFNAKKQQNTHVFSLLS